VDETALKQSWFHGLQRARWA